MKDKLVLNKSHTRVSTLNKYKNKNIDTIVLKKRLHYGGKYYDNNINVKNLEIVYKSPKMYIAAPYYTFFNIKCENIYFKDEENLGGITLSLGHMVRNNIKDIGFYWENNKEKPSNIKKLNIINSNKEPIKIELIPEELENIYINLSYEPGILLSINIENTNSIITYELDDKEELKETINKYIITERDIENGILDLRKFKDFSVLTLDNIIIDTLILNKSDIEKVSNINLYADVYIKNIKIIDENDMKLNPITIIPFDDYLDYSDKCIIGDNKNTIIYVDEENNLKVYDKEEIKKDKLIDDVIFSEERENMIIIYKYKKLGKHKIVINNKEYNIDKLFNLFVKENMHKYNLNNFKNIWLEYNDWVSIIDNSVTGEEFVTMYNDYLSFKNNLKKLHNLGFSYKYFMYLYKRKLNCVINIMCSKDFNIDKYTKEEIKALNEVGKKYIKKL